MDIGKKVEAMSMEEVDQRIAEMQQESKNLSDIGLRPSKEFEIEAMLLISKRYVDNSGGEFDECNSDIDDSLVE